MATTATSSTPTQQDAWAARYLPEMAVSASLRRLPLPTHPEAQGVTQQLSPRAEALDDDAAILIADVSGFSAAEATEERRAGRDGVDRFSETVNAVLGRALISFFHDYSPSAPGGLEAVVHANGGEVIHVAGDALICLFPGGQGPAEACAAEILRAFDEIAREVKRTTGLVFSLHGGVGGGGVTLLHLGDDGRRQFTVCGRALARAVAAMGDTRAGEFAVYGQTVRAVDAAGTPTMRRVDVNASANANANQRKTLKASSVVVERRENTGGAGMGEPAAAEKINDDDGEEKKTAGGAAGGSTAAEKEETSHLPASAKHPGHRLLSYVPEFFRVRARSGVSDVMGNTITHVCTVFVQLSDFALDLGGLPEAEESAKKLSAAFLAMSEEVARLQGLTDVLLCDDKGFVYKAVFGLLGGSEDAELRGVMAALRIRRRVRDDLGLGLRVGVAAGRAFCGAVWGGSKKYTAYTMLGSTGVTLAARLMCKAPQDAIVCSPRVYAATAADIVFEDIGVMDLKGMRAPIPVKLAVARRMSRVEDLPEDLHDGRTSQAVVVNLPMEGGRDAGTYGVDVADITVVTAVTATNADDDQSALTNADDDQSALGVATAAAESAAVTLTRDNAPASAEVERREDENERGHTLYLLWLATVRRVGGKVLLEGEAGIGKSHAVGELRKSASSSGVRIVMSKALSVECMTPLYPFIRIVNDTMRHLGGADSALRRCGATDVHGALLALLLGGLGEGGGGTAGGDQCSPDSPVHCPRALLVNVMESERKILIVDLIVDLLNVASPILVILEDAHWCDNASWRVLQAVASRCHRASLVVTSRPHHSAAAARLSTHTKTAAAAAAGGAQLSDRDRELGAVTMSKAFASIDAVRTVTLKPLSERESLSLLMDCVETATLGAGVEVKPQRASHAMKSGDGEDGDGGGHDVESLLLVAARRSGGQPLFLKEIGERVAADIVRRAHVGRGAKSKTETKTSTAAAGAPEAHPPGAPLHHRSSLDILTDLLGSDEPVNISSKMATTTTAKATTATTTKEDEEKEDEEKEDEEKEESSSDIWDPSPPQSVFDTILSDPHNPDAALLNEAPGFSRLVTQQLLSLDPARQELLRVASAYGHSFTAKSLLKTMKPIVSLRPADDNALGDYALDDDDISGPDTINNALESMQGLRFIKPTEGSPGRFEFAHDLVRSVVYNTMTGAQHKLVHELIALNLADERENERRKEMEVEVGVFKDVVEPPPDAAFTTTRCLRSHVQLAQHWEQAGHPEKAFGFFLAAGDAASSSGSYWDAINLWQRAMKCAKEANLDTHEIGFIEVRLAVTFQLKLMEWDMSLRHAASAAKCFGIPIPARITASMVKFEGALFIMGAGKRTKGAKALSRRTKRWREATVAAWAVIAWSMAGESIRGECVAEVIRLELGLHDFESAKAFCLLRSANLATTVPDTPVYVVAMTAVGNVIAAGIPVIGKMGLTRAVESMHRQRNALAHRDPEHPGDDDGGAAKMTLDLADGFLKVLLGLLQASEGGIQDIVLQYMSAASSHFYTSNALVPMANVQQIKVAILTEQSVTRRHELRLAIEEVDRLSEAQHRGYGKTLSKLWSLLVKLRAVFHQGDKGFVIKLRAMTRELVAMQESMDTEPGYAVPDWFRLRTHLYRLRNYVVCFSPSSSTADTDASKADTGGGSGETARWLAEHIVSLVVKFEVFPFLVYHMIVFTREIVVGLLHIRYLSGGAPKGWDRALRLLREVSVVGAKAHPYRELCCRLCEALCDEGLGDVKALSRSVERLRRSHAKLEYKMYSDGEVTGAMEDDVFYLALANFHLTRLLGRSAEDVKAALVEVPGQALKKETKIIFLDGAAAGIDSPGIRTDLNLSRRLRSSLLCGLF